MSDGENSKIDARAIGVRKYWFDQLPPDKRDEIIKPAFEKACPTNDAIRKVSDQYKEQTGK